MYARALEIIYKSPASLLGEAAYGSQFPPLRFRVCLKLSLSFRLHSFSPRRPQHREDPLLRPRGITRLLQKPLSLPKSDLTTIASCAHFVRRVHTYLSARASFARTHTPFLSPRPRIPPGKRARLKLARSFELTTKPRVSSS